MMWFDFSLRNFPLDDIYVSLKPSGTNERPAVLLFVVTFECKIHTSIVSKEATNEKIDRH